ncbi:DNRLRE domain-containing protein [Streptomyces cyaneofuscatus]|uniref:DNRLRE domain-containing protein n=1 Tax=Streptomyces cyaneofuscatus TaxID=66883 RepID=UPI0033AFCBAF
MRGPGFRDRTAALALAAGVAAAPPAAALTAPAGFTADHLPTYRTSGIAWSLTEANGVVHAGGTLSSVRPAGTPSGGMAPYVDGVRVAANTNYDDQQPASRGTTPYLSYLRFPLPAAPAGRVPKGARLQFRTSSSDPTAGSTDSHTVVPVTGTWTESAVTYNSRPALSASVPGSVTGATAVSTDHSVELTAPALGGALGSAYSLALTSSGTDGLRIWSSEAASAAARPQLVLTFGAE